MVATNLGDDSEQDVTNNQKLVNIGVFHFLFQ